MLQGVPVILMEPLGARQPYWQPFILNIINNKYYYAGVNLYIYIYLRYPITQTPS